MLTLGEDYCCDNGIPSFLSIVMVIIRDSGALKIKDTISSLGFKVYLGNLDFAIILAY